MAQHCGDTVDTGAIKDRPLLFCITHPDEPDCCWDMQTRAPEPTYCQSAHELRVRYGTWNAALFAGAAPSASDVVLKWGPSLTPNIASDIGLNWSALVSAGLTVEIVNAAKQPRRWWKEIFGATMVELSSL